MSDILLSFGIQKGAADVERIRGDLNSILLSLDRNPPKVRIGLTVDENAIAHFKSQLSSILSTVSLTNGTPLTISVSGLGEITAEAGRAKSALGGVANAARDASRATQQANSSTKQSANDAARAAKEAARQEQERQSLLRQSTGLITKMRDAERNWTSAATGRSRESYENIRAYRIEMESLQQQFLTGKISADQFKERITALGTGFLTSSAQIRQAGEQTKTFSERLNGLAAKFSTWLSVSQVIMLAFRSIKKMVSAVVELDTAMTELKKVTNESDATYAQFLDKAADRAKRLGASMSDTVYASADFARLGYGIEDASTLADVAIIYKNIGDGIEDISTASESIISTMQAFGIESSNAISIVDKFNEVGNNFAISSAGIGEAMKRSASAMASANNTIDETIALITAANTIVQNPESVGKNLPNNAAMRCKKTAISVKGRRRSRPRKDFVVCARRVRSSTSLCYTPEVIIMAQKTGVYTQCEYCGKTVYKTLSQYKKRKQHFCSNKCQSLLKREITFEHRPCELCGKDMYISKRSTQRFCSNECQHVWQLGNTGFNNKRFQGGYVKCEFCGKEFIVGKYVMDSNRKHFCSASCRQTWYSTVWSQSEEWRHKSRERAAGLLKNNPVITQTKPQIVVNGMLDDMDIAYRNEESYTYYSIDNYLPEFDLAVEVMGDYWHGSPMKYPNSVNDKQRHAISRDKAKHTYLKNFYGIEILYLWESDIIKRPEVCTELIRHYIECGGTLRDYHSFNYSIVDGRLELNDVIVYPYQSGRTEIAC